MSNPPDPSVPDPAAPAPSASAAVLPATSPAGPAPLAMDLPCLRCGHNLRSLLPTDRCPKCNIPIIHSIEFDRRQLNLPPLRVALVAAFFSATALLGVCASVVDWYFDQLGGAYDIRFLIYAAERVLFLVFFLPANLLMWPLGPPSWRRTSRGVPFVAAMICYLASAVFGTLLSFLTYQLISRGAFAGNFPPTLLIYGTSVLPLFQSAAVLVLLLFVIHFLRVLAQRDGYRQLRPFILPVFGAQVLLTLLVMALCIYTIQRTINESGEPWPQTLWLIADISRGIIETAALIIWFDLLVLAIRQHRITRALPPMNLPRPAPKIPAR